MYVYKINVLEELKKKGYPQGKLRSNKILGGGTIEKIRNLESITLDTLNTVCIMLKCQISDIIEIVPTSEELEKYY